MPTVSVLISTYNRAGWLAEAIASVRAQTFQDWELIVVVDGSTDDTVERLQRLASDEPCLRIVTQLHQGLSAGRNTGIRAARGELIAFLDDDDRWMPEKLEREVEHLRRHPEAGGVFVAANLIDAGGRPMNRVIGRVEPCVRTLVMEEEIWLPSQTMIRRECFKQAGLFDETLRHCGDRQMWIRILLVAPIQKIEEALVEYRIHSGNMSSQRLQVLTDRIRAFRKLPLAPAAGLTRRLLSGRMSQLHDELARRRVLMERCTIIVDARDKFSTMTKCLETLLANTPEPHDLMVVVGGAPEHVKQQWIRRFGDRAQFIFKTEFLNQAQARNIGLRQAKTRLAVVMDCDNFVRPGWLTALLECQRDTKAVMVVPLILDARRRIHTAGNDLYIAYEGGKAYGHKELRFGGLVYAEGSNLKRQRTDYGELHCQLVEVEPTLRLGVYDERIVEVGEVDTGLTWAKGGYEMWFEPKAVVFYTIDSPVKLEDVELFKWRWDPRLVLEGYRYFEQKWSLDISEHGTFADFLMWYNRKLGLLPRLLPARLGMVLDVRLAQARRVVSAPGRRTTKWFQEWKRNRVGYYDWFEGIPNGRHR